MAAKPVWPPSEPDATESELGEETMPGELVKWLREMHDWQDVLDQEHDDRLAYDYQYRTGGREPQDTGEMLERLRTAQRKVKEVARDIAP